MKKITKMDVENAMRDVSATAHKDQVVAGRISEIRISGGVLKEVAGGVQYLGTNGSSCLFKGVELSDTFVKDGTAYQIGGTITVSPEWANDGFTVYDFAHEYGHYLQEQQMSTMEYYSNALYSMYSLLTNPSGHMDLPFEKQATELGNAYLKEHWIAGH